MVATKTGIPSRKTGSRPRLRASIVTATVEATTPVKSPATR
jgi:hypothetical protein